MRSGLNRTLAWCAASESLWFWTWCAGVAWGLLQAISLVHAHRMNEAAARSMALLMSVDPTVARGDFPVWFYDAVPWMSLAAGVVFGVQCFVLVVLSRRLVA